MMNNEIQRQPDTVIQTKRTSKPLLNPVFRLTIILVAMLFVQCRTHHFEPPYSVDVLPASPQYADSSQWYITDRNAPADIFYITSTETGDYPVASGDICHFNDTYNDSTRHLLYSEMRGVDRLVSGELNYYSPYYRQCTLQTFVSDSTVQARLPIAIDDVKHAFGYYLQHLNGGRPFVLAGYSQGAMILLELLKNMDDATYNRMIAAYAIGVTISQNELKACPHIVPAHGDGDTGVTICYNSVKDASCAMRGFEHSDVVINPVNWRTDATPATLITMPSPHMSQQYEDTLTVHIDESSGLLYVDGYTGTGYILPLIGKAGCYHSREIWLYRDQLRDNIANRTANYLRNQ
ncbi:MAG: DUF3089 domain-containing protein [Muribaculaceae bacterium]|nr:DUF3089 domain-containing protein [Muribaculaceae bacterium]